MKNCPSCGAQLSDEARFCPYCMTSLNEKKSVAPAPKKRFPFLLFSAGALVLTGAVFAVLALTGVFSGKENALPPQSLDAALPQNETKTSPAPETLPGTLPETAPQTEPGTSVADTPVTTPGVETPGGETPVITPGVDVPGVETPGVETPGGETPAHTHTPVLIPAVAPTCTESGLSEGSRCSVCGEILTAQTTLPATGHKAVTDAAVAPTCLKTGLTEGSHCSVCGEVFTAQQTVPKVAHRYSEATYSAPATCVWCGATTGTALEAPYLEFTLNSKPPRKSSFNGNLYIQSVDSIEKIYNGDGTYTVRLTATVKNLASSAYVGGIPAKYAYLGPAKEADEGWGSLSAGETGQLGAVFYNVPGGYYYITI